MGECTCGGSGRAKTLIFACSGGADVGAISDRVARRLNLERAGTMFCLAAVSAGVPTIVEKTAQAEKLLVIDGCAGHCALKTLAKAGFSNCRHLALDELGFVKGESPASDAAVEAVLVRARELLAQP